MKRGTPNHPKMKLLALELSIPIYAAVGILETLWHFCAEYTPDGAIGKYTDAYLAKHIEWAGDAKAMIKALIKTGWLDKSKKHRLIVHDWSQHADDMVHAKLFRAQIHFADDIKPNPSRITKEERAKILRESGGSRGHDAPPAGALPEPGPSPAPPMPMPGPSPAGAEGISDSGAGLISSESGNGSGSGFHHELTIGDEGTVLLKQSILAQIDMNSKDRSHLMHRRDITPATLRQEVDRLTAAFNAKKINSVGAVLVKNLCRQQTPPRRGPVRVDE